MPPRSRTLTPPSIDLLPRGAVGGYDQLGAIIGRARADANAQQSGSPLGIENVRRGVLAIAMGNLGANISVPVGGYAALSTPLQGRMFLSGRPLEIHVAGNFSAGASGNIGVSVRLRGAVVNGVALPPGAGTNSTAVVPFHFYWVDASPAPGDALVEVVARAATAPGTIGADANYGLILSAVEV